MATDQEIGRRLAQAREAAGYRTATAGAEALGMVYSTYAGHENGNRGLRGNLERYARRYGVSVDWLLTGRGNAPDPKRTRPGMVRLQGRVGAGQAIEPFDDDQDQWVEAPSDAQPTTEAVEVDGESMLPAYEPGTILYYSKTLPPHEMVNRRAVVKLADGGMLVKVLRRGSAPDLWTLQSINSIYQDLPDRVVEWAAPIDWTKPRS